jgi:glycosyltransferase involved in cell wall biosynthesis
MTSLSVVIPAHNEEKTIGEFVKSISLMMKKLLEDRVLEDYEIIVLDDGSTDGTNCILQQIEYERTKVIFNGYASGIHKAFLQLYSEALADWILLVPGDAQWPASEIEKLIIFHFEPKLPMPTVTRRKVKAGYSSFRLLASTSFGLFAKLFLRKPNQVDPGSIKILPKEVATLNYKCNSVLIEIERMRYCEVRFGKLRELEVEIVPRLYGSSSTVAFETLRPILMDCCKMLIFYVLCGKDLTAS